MPEIFFDRVIENALRRDARQFVAIGAEPVSAARRYARPGTAWWLVADAGQVASDQAGDQPGDQASDQEPPSGPAIRLVPHEPGGPGLSTALTGAGFEPDIPAVICADLATGQPSPAAIAVFLAESRSLATPGTRLAVALPREFADEPETAGLIARARWRMADLSERAQQAGLRLLVPVWAPAPPGTPPSAGRIAAFAERVLYRSGSEDLAGHLEAAYSVKVRATRELDLGVHRVDLTGGRSWIARIFPAARAVDDVQADGRLLSWLGSAGFPAERCAADEPVSVLDGQGVLITERAKGRPMAASPPSFELLGRLLGRLHQLRAADEPAALRPGGAWHHLLPAGSPAEEIVALRTLLHDARHRVPAGAGDRYDVLLAAAEAADGCADLPHALIHPDPVHRNAIAGPDGGATIIDWAGSGWGPRVSSLGCLLWAAAGDQRSIRAAISGYQESVTVEPAEVDRLRAAMRLRPLVLGCWTFATGRDNLRNVTDRWEQQCQRIDAGFEHARTALATGARSGGQGKQLR